MNKKIYSVLVCRVLGKQYKFIYTIKINALYWMYGCVSKIRTATNETLNMKSAQSDKYNLEYNSVEY
jgi:ribosomal protein L18E